ncbi:hypothetical protein [Umezawaea beigongshangensis]|uniref:hypothetical protein n=1 Tax=Umezawaea beigongshangensis TaxID=2780383 RepID=UPI0018F26740|nr:hypothetical protein [Umezawaea beigongshangensis]
MSRQGAGLDWDRLARAVVDRRTRLDLTQEAVYAAGGPSTVTLRYIESSGRTRYQPLILARLERALGWEAGSVDRILRGGNPVLAQPDEALPGEDVDPAVNVEADEVDAAVRILESVRAAFSPAVFAAALRTLGAQMVDVAGQSHTERVNER